jgi:hypothetical protein
MEHADMGTAGDRTQVRRPEKNRKLKGDLKAGAHTLTCAKVLGCAAVAKDRRAPRSRSTSVVPHNLSDNSNTRMKMTTNDHERNLIFCYEKIVCLGNEKCREGLFLGRQI